MDYLKASSERRGGHDLATFYRSLIERTFDLVMVINDGRRITFCNHAATSLLGYLPEGLIGQSVLDLVHSEDAERLRRMLDAPSASSPVFPYRLCHANGSWRLVESQTSRTVDIDGSKVTVIVARDITVDHQLESERQRAARSAALGRMTAEVAHDVSNLLHAMTLQVELLGEATPVDRAAATEPLARALEAATDLTGQLLAFARGGAEAVGDDAARTDAHTLINRSRMLLRTLARRATKINFSLEAASTDVGLTSNELMQILVNLVANARDAMPDGGQLTIATRNVGTGCSGRRTQFPHGALALEITDTGSGMPINVKTRIFDPFFTTKPAGNGTGLGLPAVLSIVRRVGGCIEVDSAPGQGTTVRILLPPSAGALLHHTPSAA